MKLVNEITKYLRGVFNHEEKTVEDQLEKTEKSIKACRFWKPKRNKRNRKNLLPVSFCCGCVYRVINRDVPFVKE